MAFKQDEDFLRFITMGAAGSAAAAGFLSDQHGHRMVELERHAMANKIWTTKIKRLRVPDLLCLDCGLRVEARAKSKLEIKVSDSAVAGREWDAGLRDEDVIAFIRWDAERGRASDVVECFTVVNMRAALDYSRLGGRKSASEGAERDRSWTARVAKTGGEILAVDGEAQLVSTRLDTGRRQTYSIPSNVPAYVYVKKGELFRGFDQFLIGAVRPSKSLDCGCRWRPARLLDRSDPITRYIVVKACGLRADAEAFEALQRLSHDDPDPRIALEALASLARIEPETYTRLIAATVDTQDVEDRDSVAMAMEALFILSELGTESAAEALLRLSNDSRLTPEQRCAAVWGLGVAGVERDDLVMDFIADSDDDVALHALAAMGPLDDRLLAEAKKRLSGSANDREAASTATLLSTQGERGIDALRDVACAGGAAAAWAIAALGDMPERRVRAVGNGRLSTELEARLQPMWARSSSWLLRQAADTPLDFLKRQTVRHKP